MLYDVFTFIEVSTKTSKACTCADNLGRLHLQMRHCLVQDAVQGGGRVLVHCSQGVSRSATFVIAYLMWKRDIPYDQAYQAVKAIRGVTNPNIGFTCQVCHPPPGHCLKTLL